MRHFRSVLSALPAILVLGAMALPPITGGSPTRPSGLALAASSAGAVAVAPATQDAASQKSRDRKRDRTGSDDCPGGLQPLPGTDFCTHGPDPTPPGLEKAGRVQPMAARTARRAASDFSCDGDGVSGYRVQVLYVRAQTAADRFSEYLPSIRAWTAGADEIMQESATATGGSRRFRFVADDCQIDVQPVALPDADVASFGRMINALDARGFSRSDRYYLSFVDLDPSPYCGIATYWEDDRPGTNNLNNSGPGYSRVDADDCWDAEVVAHELLHNLGGVQPSAPHSTPYGHCIDEWDVMCYRDSSTTRLQTICGDQSLERRYDCRNDDYFHTHPPAGSYLDTHWNTANNRFLISGQDDTGGDTGTPSGTDTGSPTVAISSPKQGAKPKGKKRITLAATAEDAGAGVASVEFRRCRGSDCSWDAASSMGSDASAPFSRQWKLPKKGTYTVLAQATDQQGNAAVSDPVTIRIKKDRGVKRDRKRS